MKRRSFTLGLSTTVAGVLAGCLSGTSLAPDRERTESRTYDVSDGMELRVRNENAPVTVQVFDGDAIEVDIVFRGPSTEALDDISMTDKRTDGALMLETEYGTEAEQSSASLTIRCPKTVDLGGVETSNGSIEVDVLGIGDETEIATSNGSIDIALASDLNTEVTASTTNGSVEVEDLNFNSIERSNTELSGSLGSGEHTLALETMNASISIYRLSSDRSQ